MASKLDFFMVPEDEKAFFRLLARHQVTVYPDLIPPGWKPLVVDPDAALVAGLDQGSYYLAFERLAPVVVHPIKRGPDRGMLKIEEIPSPVFHYERSQLNEAGELEGGRIWAELIQTGATQDLKGKPRALNAVFEEVHQLFRKSWRRSDPKGYWIGPKCGDAVKRSGLKLREPGHKGRLYEVWR
jgi:hypothetical protein